MPISSVKIEGFEEADKLLGKIADPERRNQAFVGGLKAASQLVVSRAKELVPAPGYPGDKPGLKALRNTLGHIVKQYTSAFVAIIGPQRPAGAHGHLVEGGTRPHVIKSRLHKALAFRSIMRKEINHPGARPKPFLSPAATDTRPQQEAAIIEGINKLVNP
jgi:hypothetical protein